VIVDDLLPGVSGLELCQQITSNPSTRQIPVIILSAGTEQIPQNALASVGAFAALRKPFEPRKLLNTVEASLGAHV
jgi:CheY-like chemotaxis protein